MDTVHPAVCRHHSWSTFFVRSPAFGPFEIAPTYVGFPSTSDVQVGIYLGCSGRQGWAWFGRLKLGLELTRIHAEAKWVTSTRRIASSFGMYAFIQSSERSRNDLNRFSQSSQLIVTFNLFYDCNKPCVVPCVVYEDTNYMFHESRITRWIHFVASPKW